MSRRPDLASRLAAAVLAVATLGVAWGELFSPREPGVLAALCLVALLPALSGAVAWRRRLTVPLSSVVAAVLGIALALSLSPVSLLVDPAAWQSVADAFPQGLRAASSNDLPIAAADEPALAALLEIALVVLAGAAAWQAGARGTPVGTVVALGAGLAYRWTVLPPDQPVVAGAIGLAAIVAIVALLGVTRPRTVAPRVAGAAALGGIALVVGVLGSGPARADGAWLDWTSWELGTGGGGSDTASLDLEQRYGQLDWPETPRVVLRVTSPRRLHLQAAALETFDGIAFGLGATGPPEPVEVEDGRIRLPEPAEEGDRHSQEVQLASARSNLLLAPGRPLGFSGDVGDFAERLGESVRVEPGLGPKARYTVTSVVPDVRPATLLAAPPPAEGEVEEHLTQVRAGAGGRVVDVPLWGTGERLPDPSEFGAYAGVVELAQEITRGADSQYEAVNRIEAHLRSAYTYDERPPFPRGGTVPIADFVENTRRGFCQQFAGSMGVMLRGLGIPTRVAVGYTGGRFDPDRGDWTVLDRDAHSWIEVYFSGHGWVPFDPTPGRAVSSPASVSSPEYSPIEAAVEDGVVEEAVEPPSRDEELAADDANEPIDEETSAVGPVDDGGGSGGWGGPLLGVAGALLALLALGALAPTMMRRARRSRARRGGDPRVSVLAAAEDLERELRRRGIGVPESATPSERARIIHRASGVDVSTLYADVTRARYARTGSPIDPRAAWRAADDARSGLGRRRRRHGRSQAHAEAVSPDPGSLKG